MNKLEKDFFYPEQNDPNIQEKIFKKREFYYHRIPKRNKLKNFEEIQKYRDENCQPGFEARAHQKILTNFINPNSPYSGLLLIHGTGTGKTASAISIAEQFKDQVKKYNTKIYVVVPGPNTRENWKNELIFTTGETYIKNKEILNQMTKYERERETKIGIYSALQFYRILSYKTFYRKVLGEKIAEKKITDDNKIKKDYKKKEDGSFEREIVIDKINNMDNSIIIIDEAHNITNNEYGESLKTIIKKSKNLKVILLSATPMKNLAEEIIELLNFLKPKNEKIKKDEIFTKEDQIHLIKFKPNGKKILKEKSSGYVSFFRGNIPFTFAKRIDIGKIPKGLLFTPLVQCKLESFQLKNYNLTLNNSNDPLDRASSSAANFIFPGLDKNKKDLNGYHSTEGLNILLSQINTDKNKLLKLINKKIFKNKLKSDILQNFLKETDNKNLIGNILHIDYLKHFSIKFYNCIKNLNRLNDRDLGSGTAFIYSNLVKAGGIELFSNCLIQNGYLEYKENFKDYDIKDNTLDAITGKTFAEFKKKNLSEFNPATFILITGSIDESGEDIPEVKQKQIRDVFNNNENKKGKLIKFVLGSQVMNEGITLKNTKEIHILDVHYNLGKLEQVIGRGIRMCMHQDLVTNEYRYPEVNVYRYVVSLKNNLSTDEKLYKKAELKYLLVKETEKVLKEAAIDCPLLINQNKFPEEIDEYKGCVPPSLENLKKNKKICPALCDFSDCDLKCDNKSLNKKYWNKKIDDYKTLTKKEIDYNTFNDKLAKFEIDDFKNKIKDLYRFEHIYEYDKILAIIMNSINKNNIELFDKKYLDIALEQLMPKTDNDFNNFNDVIFDKYNKSGYLIQRGKYYIFQPNDEKTNVPYYYRKKFDIKMKNLVSINNYTKTNFKHTDKKKENKIIDDKKNYDFDSTLKYYDNRDENNIVGIIEKSKNKANSLNDLFKIRPSRNKEKEKKRGTGIYSFTGAACSSKDKQYLLDSLKNLKPHINETDKKFKKTRDNLCQLIKNRLLFLEKYATTNDNNKKTYIMVPNDHPFFPYPYNLEDRIKNTIKKIKKITNREFNYEVKKMKNGSFLGVQNEKLNKYLIELKNDKYIENNKKDIIKLGFEMKDKKWQKLII
jgi:hypothetical protein